MLRFCAVMVLLCGCGVETKPAEGTNGPKSSCTAIDAGTPQVAFLRSLWPEGCIDLFYTLEMEHEMPVLRSALAVWAAPECTRLCFNPPQIWMGTPNRPNTILLHLDHGALARTDPNVTVFITDTPGRSSVRQSSTVVRRPNTTATFEEFVTAAGHVLGMIPTTGVDSALNGPRASLTDADQQSACSLYPCR